MKKLLFSFAAICVGFVASAQVQRTVLIEEFTQASCGPCASQNPAFNALLSANPSKVVSIKYQTSWPGSDPMNAQNPTEVATRVTKYNVTGVPFAVIDGDTNKNPQTAQAYAGAPYNINQTMIDNEYALTSPFTLNATYNYNSTTDSVTTVINYINSSPNSVMSSSTGNLKLMVALVEMNVNFTTAPGTNGETAFYYVMRKMYPDASGTTLPDAIAANANGSFTFKFKPPTYIYQKQQMAIVCFIQDLGNNTVYQARLAVPPGVIDAAATYNGTSTSTDLCSASMNPSVKLTNMGNTPITSATVGYTVNGTGGTSQNWTGSLTNGQNATITFPAITAPTGVNVYHFYVNNINAGAIDLNEANNSMDDIITQVVGTATTPFYETFESAAVGASVTSQSILTILGGSWVVDKTINTSLTQKLGAYGQSDKSYRFKFYDVPAGYRLGLVFYKNNISGTTYDNVTFDYAYNNYTDASGSAYDTLSVLLSSDCGNTWTEIWNKSGTNLKTTSAAGTGSNYYPAVTEWMQGVATIPSSFKSSTELLVKFDGRSGYGNNLYLDNVRFWYPAGVTNVGQDNIEVYPNPTSSDVHISGITGDATFTIVDVLGRTIQTESMNNIHGVVSMSTNGMAKGTYTLRITQDAKTTTKNIVVTE